MLVGAPCHLKSDSRSDQDPTKVTPAVALFCGRSSVVDLGQAPLVLEKVAAPPWNVLITTDGHSCRHVREACAALSPFAHRSVCDAAKH